MKCWISRSLLDRLGSMAHGAPDREICGVLIGEGTQICDAVSVPNVAQDPDNGFVLDPFAHLGAARAARRAGLTLIGHYHSHPSGNLFPSASDASQAWEQGRYWLILSGRRQRLWISRRHGSAAGAFEPVELQIYESAALATSRQ